MHKFKIQRKLKIDSELNMSSMTDIIFLLLFFFMLTSNISTSNGMNVSLPESSESKEVKSQILITLKNKETIIYKNEQVTIGELSEKIKNDILTIRESKNNAAPTVVLNADKDLPIGILVQVADIVQMYGGTIAISTINKPK